MQGLVPARYVGNHPINLVAALGPYFNADGTRRTSLAVSNGDVLLMPEREILGQTYLLDPKHQRDPLDLGVGKRVLPEHVDKTDEELSLLGYEFHQGRPDWQPIVEQETTPGSPVAPEQPTIPMQLVETPVTNVVRGG